MIILFFSIITKAQPVLETPADGTTGYSYVKVTYTWDSLDNATTYDLQVRNDTASTASYIKTYTGLSVFSYTPSSDYLQYNTQYYWRLRANVGGIYTDYSNYFTFTTGKPSDTISNVNALILLDHSNGRITQLSYLGGSGQQLLNTYQNDKNKTGLGRVNNETSTKISSWSEDTSGTYIYNYDNAVYGSKQLTIKSTVDSVTVDISVNVGANKTAILNAAWQPGGDIGPLNDAVLYSKNSTQLTKVNLLYPGTATTLYKDTTNLTAMTDARYNEYFGYKSAVLVPTFIQQAVAFGPTFTFPASSTAQTIDLTFGVMNKSKFFAWTGNKYVIVDTPAAGSSWLSNSQHNVKWQSFGNPGNVTITLDTTGNNNFNVVLASNKPDNGSFLVTMPNRNSSVPLTSSRIKVTAGTTSDTSGVFSIVPKTSIVFSIPNTLTGAPTDSVNVPVFITPVAGDSISAFDLRLFYDNTVLTYSKSTIDTSLNNWSIGVTNSSNSYIQIGGFANKGAANKSGVPITSFDTLVTLKFIVKSTARVGTQTALKINNSYLSAADTNAVSLPVSASDGLITLYTRVSGFLRYMFSNKPIAGTTTVRFIDVASNGITYGSTNSKGYFDFSNKAPGSAKKLVPIDTVYSTPIVGTVTATDALKVFAGRDGGPTPLTPLQNVVADVNGDGKINSTDAYAILKMSVGSLTAKSYGLSNWVFIDSSYSVTASNWAAAPRFLDYTPLDSVNSNQSFLGAIRGDVDGSYSLPSSINKSSAINNIDGTNIVLLSVPDNLNVRPGDTLSLPLNVKLNGKTIGAFNTSIQLDKNLVSFSGTYEEGSSLPSNKGWSVSTYFDANGMFNIGAADFSDAITPISTDGPIAVFKFIVNNNAKIGDTIQVKLSGITVSDPKLNPVLVSSKDGKVTISNVTSTDNTNIIYEYSLAQNYPNPFNPSTTIEYSIKKQSNVLIEIYNAIGQRVVTLFNGSQPSGLYKLNWNAKKLASGVYFYRIKAGEFNLVKKMLLLK
jgi:hypothetical protein